MKSFIHSLLATALVLVSVLSVGVLHAQQKPQVENIYDSNYVMWNIARFAQEVKSVKKDATSTKPELTIVEDVNRIYGTNIRFVRAQYPEAMNQYSVGNAAGVFTTSWDLLLGPAANGINSVVYDLQDFSNGNDCVKIWKKYGEVSWEKLTTFTFVMVHKSLSSQVLYRMFQAHGIDTKSLNLNIQHVDNEEYLLDNFRKTENQEGFFALVTWKPYAAQAEEEMAVRDIWNTSNMPEEVFDFLAVTPEFLKRHPNNGKAISEIIRRCVDILRTRSADRAKFVQALAVAAGGGTTTQSVERQLLTTAIYYDRASAKAATLSPKFYEAHQRIYDLLEERGWMVDANSKPTRPGVWFPDGRTLGDPKNIRIRFEVSQYDKSGK